ncbi:MAG: hypothetical protein K0U68_00455 [Gammaproteobacteria bacterium]|nr:hypothetical protein [Gammaproteobacteria bacterium]
MISSLIPEFLVVTSLTLCCYSTCVFAEQDTDELSIEFLEFLAEVDCVAEDDCAHPFISETPITGDLSVNQGDDNTQSKQHTGEQVFTDE